MANGGFLTKRILLTKEDANGNIPASPVCIELITENFDFKTSEATEELNFLGDNGDAGGLSFGSKSYSGGIGLVASTDNAVLILTHVLGTATSDTELTTTDWASDTAYAVGDVVNHSDDKHSLVCLVAGTSGSDEPTLASNPNDDRNKKVIDNTVTWIAMPVLRKATFQREQFLPTFTIEYELENAQGEKFYERFSNVYGNTLPIEMSGSTISLKMGADFVGVKSTDSTEDGFTPLASMSGAKIVKQFKEFYSYGDSAVKIDDNALCGIESLNMTVTRNISVEKGLNDCSLVNIGITNVKGTQNRVFTIEDFKNNKAHTDFKLDYEFSKPNGCFLKVEFGAVTPQYTAPAQSIDKQVYISGDISAKTNNGIPSTVAELIYPALVDSSDGSIIGAY